jgi:hypothetical protein
MVVLLLASIWKIFVSKAIEEAKKSSKLTLLKEDNIYISENFPYPEKISNHYSTFNSILSVPQHTVIVVYGSSTNTGETKYLQEVLEGNYTFIKQGNNYYYNISHVENILNLSKASFCLEGDYLINISNSTIQKKGNILMIEGKNYTLSDDTVCYLFDLEKHIYTIQSKNISLNAPFLVKENNLVIQGKPYAKLYNLDLKVIIPYEETLSSLDISNIFSLVGAYKDIYYFYSHYHSIPVKSKEVFYKSQPIRIPENYEREERGCYLIKSVWFCPIEVLVS